MSLTWAEALCYLFCELSLLSNICELSLLLLYFIEEPPVIAGIYRVNRPSEDDTFENHMVKDNRQLLWHGVHSAFVIDILKHGLQVDKRNARRIGLNVGDVRMFSIGCNKNL